MLERSSSALGSTQVVSASALRSLSFSQQWLWLRGRVVVESVAYTIARAFRVQAALDLDALQHAFQSLVDRHVALRMAFVLDEPTPRLRVYEQMPVTLGVEDCAALSEQDLRSRVQAIAGHAFHVDQPPLIRLHVCRRSAADTILVLVSHSCFIDEISADLLADDLWSLYEIALGGGGELPTPAISYLDMMQQQEALLASDEGRRLADYWQRYLAGASSDLNLPIDHPRPAERTYRGVSHFFELEPALAQQIAALAESRGVTVQAVMLAAFQVLLYRYSGQTDLLLGRQTSGRYRPELADVVGCLINPVAFRAQLAGNPGFYAVLSQAHDGLEGALQHRAYPTILMSDPAQTSDLSHTPLFQAVYAIDDSELMETDELDPRLLHGVPIQPFELDDEMGRIDLALMIVPGRDGLRAIWDYNPDLFEAATIIHMTEHLLLLLAAVTADPAQRIAALPLLTEAERQQLVEWNATATPVPAELGIADLFADQAARTPDAVAVIFDEQALTYRELNAAANRLAHALRARGVGASAQDESRVGILLDRSLELVIALLAVLKAGGAYVPLDPSYPAERVQFVAHDADLALLLTLDSYGERLDLPAERILSLDHAAALLATQPATNPQRLQPSDTLAYVIYTSGSTGRPKGVLVPQQAVVNFFVGMDQVVGDPRDHTWLAVTSVAFDISVLELLWTLTRGARVVLHEAQGAARSATQRQDERTIPAQIARHGVTHLQGTPSLARMILSDPNGANALATLDTLLLGGEALPASLARQLHAAGVRRLLNMYGPTETTIWSATHAVNAADEPVPIGRPIANTQLYILDRYLHPVPTGITGELYIGGAGVVRGYHGRPDLTADRFIPDAFSSTPGARLYRTGDSARYRADGSVEFLGRVDFQVKVRGFRIELGEIEAALGQHPAVQACVVVAREDEPGSARLVAYVVENKEQTNKEQTNKGKTENLEPRTKNLQASADGGSTLREFLRERLPEYMVPAEVVLLDALPQTPNGKIDRKALPAPEQTRSRTERVAPRTTTETTLAGIWSEVLGLAEIGVHDNFFELGGDSIRSFQAGVRAQQAGLRVTPGLIFQHRTIAELAAVIDAARPNDEHGAALATIPLTPPQRRFFARELAQPQAWQTTLLAELPLGLDPDLLEQATRQVVQAHEALRVRFVHEAGAWRQVLATIDEPLDRFDLAAVPSAEQAAALATITAEVQASLDLQHGPLLRIALIHRGEQPSRLLLVAHQLVADVYACRLLVNDLHSAYHQLERGQPVQLPAIPTTFRQWSDRLTRAAQEIDEQAALDEWQTRLAGNAARLDESLGAAPSDGSADSQPPIVVALDAATTQSLLARAGAAQPIVLNNLVVTAVAQALAARIGRSSLLIDLADQRRAAPFDDVFLPRTVSQLTTIAPALLALKPELEPAAALQTISEQLQPYWQRGWIYGLLRDHTAAELPQAEVALSLDWSAAVLAGAWPVIAVDSSWPDREYRLAIHAAIAEERLALSWTHHPAIPAAAVEQLARHSLEVLRALAAAELRPLDARFVASDFPEADLSQDELDALLAELGD